MIECHDDQQTREDGWSPTKVQYGGCLKRRGYLEVLLVRATQLILETIKVRTNRVQVGSEPAVKLAESMSNGGVAHSDACSPAQTT
jgi:hypothetical protein